MDIEKLKALIARREQIDAEIREAVGEKKERASKKCSICQSEEHTARTCPQRQQQ
jgi:hypothetical protein